MRAGVSVPPAVVWGADVGGTSTRVAVATLDGTVVSVATAGPGNPHTVGIEVAAERIRLTAERALACAEPSTVCAAAIGLAGVTAVDPAAFADAVAPGLPMRVVPDLAAAYASGTCAPHGVVALAGTGAGAMEFNDGDLVRRRGGWGWLLGDEGSAQWLGRAAVRHALEILETDPVESDVDPLTIAVTTRFDVDSAGPDAAGRLIGRVLAGPPADLGRLAPLVTAACGTAAADDILGAAADHVAGYARGLLAGRDLPIVLAGSLLGPGGPLGDPVRKRLADLPGPVNVAQDGLAGACWLALGLVGTRTDAAHLVLTNTAGCAPRAEATG